MANKPTPETARVITANEVEIGDEIYVSERWYGSLPGMGDRWRTVVDIDKEAEDSFLLIPEVLHGEPRSLVQWVRPNTLVIVRK